MSKSQTNFDPDRYILHTFVFVPNDCGLIMLLQERASHSNLQSLQKKNKFRPSIEVLVTIS
jgi:hypothetical protein